METEEEGVREGDLRIQCGECGVAWWMDFDPEPEHYLCELRVFRLGVVQDGFVVFTGYLDSDGKEWVDGV